jgi:predicted  nucleic acid-binding Zn-ribbon protein
MSQIDLLYRLQKIDDELRAKKKRLGEVLRLQKPNETLLQARATAAVAAAASEELQAQQRALNLEIRSVADKAKQSEERLYSGVVKNTKELADLQKEINSLVKRRGQLDDSLLEIMLQLEAAQEAQAAVDNHLAQLEAEFAAAKAHLQVEQQELAIGVNQLMTRRESHLPQITAVALDLYNDTVHRRGTTAVVILRVGRCEGCQLTVSSQKVKDVSEGKLVQCGSCGRILRPV